MKGFFYTTDQIGMAIEILEAVQDGMQVEDKVILWDMIEEVINILAEE